VADVPDGRDRPDDGPGECFFRYFPEKIQPAIDRYHGEVRRLFGVLDTQLEVASTRGEYSIADIANWAGCARTSGPALARWVAQLERWWRNSPRDPLPARHRRSPRPVRIEDGKGAERFVEEARKMVRWAEPRLKR